MRLPKKNLSTLIPGKAYKDPLEQRYRRLFWIEFKDKFYRKSMNKLHVMMNFTHFIFVSFSTMIRLFLSSHKQAIHWWRQLERPCWKLDRECHVDFCMFLTPHELNFELLMKTQKRKMKRNAWKLSCILLFWNTVFIRSCPVVYVLYRPF